MWQRNSSAIIYGVLTGILFLVLHVVFYYNGKGFLISAGFVYALFFLHLPFMIFAGLSLRNKNGGLVDFIPALRTAMITFLIGTVLYYIQYYTLFGMDESLVEMQKEHAFSMLERQKENGLIKPEQFRAMTKDWENTDMTPRLSHLPFDFIIRTLFGFVLGALAAVAVRR